MAAIGVVLTTLTVLVAMGASIFAIVEVVRSAHGDAAARRRAVYASLIALFCAMMPSAVGLVGTVYGLVFAFQGVASADPAQKATLLAGGISEAMNATAIGLLSSVIFVAVSVPILGLALWRVRDRT